MTIYIYYVVCEFAINIYLELYKISSSATVYIYEKRLAYIQI